MHGCTPFFAAAGCRVEKPRRRSRTLRSGCSAGASTWGALLFGHFLLGKQEKVTRPPAGGRNLRRPAPARSRQTRKRTEHPAQRAGQFAIKPHAARRSFSRERTTTQATGRGSPRQPRQTTTSFPRQSGGGSCIWLDLRQPAAIAPPTPDAP
ncbi:hypothetical protein AGQ50_24470 [Salmonella enterica subsp. enterica]|nr:hypothetical protein AGQ50_24470 [Salmonella enterica subsp. enterica]